ncbi:hypothetical protein V3C99_012743 [Haemonchus contortus]
MTIHFGWLSPQTKSLTTHSLNTGAYNRENNLVGAIGIVRSAKDEFNVKDLHPEEQKLVNNFRKTCYISTLIVAPDFRKKGIATQLLQRGTTRLAQKGSQLVYLHVLHSNIPAIRLYEKLGFERVADVPNYYTINGAQETGIIYSKGLTSGTCQQCGTQDCRCTIT